MCNEYWLKMKRGAGLSPDRVCPFPFLIIKCPLCGGSEFTVTMRQVVFNPCTRRWEVVYLESEIPEGATLITQYWCRSGVCWVIIPE